MLLYRSIEQKFLLDPSNSMNEGKQILNLYMKLKFMLDHSDPSELHDVDGEGTYKTFPIQIFAD